MPRFFELVSLAFKSDHEYIDSVFPSHTSAPGRKIGAERMLAIMRADPNTTLLKVVNDKNEIIAGGKWNIYNRVVPAMPDLQGVYWKDEEEKEFARHMFGAFLAPRFKEITESGGNLVVLDMLMVDLSYQRQGAGRLLVKWGTALADGMGVEAVVEASEQGRGLYAQEGFEILEKHECLVPEKFEARRKQWFWWMRRPTQPKA